MSGSVMTTTDSCGDIVYAITRFIGDADHPSLSLGTFPP